LRRQCDGEQIGDFLVLNPVKSAADALAALERAGEASASKLGWREIKSSSQISSHRTGPPQGGPIYCLTLANFAIDAGTALRDRSGCANMAHLGQNQNVFQFAARFASADEIPPFRKKRERMGHPADKHRI
jgi:hypothetical protein